MRSSGALKRGVGEVVECLTAGFTAVTLPFDLSSTCFNTVFSKSHNRMIVAMRTNKPIFMLLLRDFINRTIWSCQVFRRDCKKYISSCLPLSSKAIASFFNSFKSIGKSSPNHDITLIIEQMFLYIKY